MLSIPEIRYIQFINYTDFKKVIHTYFLLINLFIEKTYATYCLVLNSNYFSSPTLKQFQCLQGQRLTLMSKAAQSRMRSSSPGPS